MPNEEVPNPLLAIGGSIGAISQRVPFVFDRLSHLVKSMMRRRIVYDIELGPRNDVAALGLDAVARRGPIVLPCDEYQRGRSNHIFNAAQRIASGVEGGNCAKASARTSFRNEQRCNASIAQPKRMLSLLTFGCR